MTNETADSRIVTDARNAGLPPEVIERMGDSLVNTLAKRGKRQGEMRMTAKVEVRESSSGTRLEGYATVYDFAYEVAGGPPFGWSETIVRGAADKSVSEGADVRYLVNHVGLPIARTKSGTLILESDDTGLRVETTPLDMSNPTVAELVSTMKRGDVDEMSFAFRAIRQEWNDDYTERFITELELFDVSNVTFPANPAAISQIRNTQPASPPDETTPVGMPIGLARAYRDALTLRRP